MIDRFVAFCLHHRVSVIALAVLLAIFGIYAWETLSVEAYPELGDVASQVTTQVPGLAAEEVEQLITVPLERAINGTPGMILMRSQSTFGLSLITVLFRDGYDDYWVRQRLDERISQATLPAGASPLPAWPVPAYQPAASGTNSMAIASMVLGVAEFFTAGLTAIPAVVCGHIARRQMKLTSQRGDGLATSGLVLGYMAIIFWSVLIAASLVGVAISIAHNGQSFPGGPPGP